MKSYVHGYTEREATRLKDQANTLEEIIHHDTTWHKGGLILEAGCGTGAQTKIVAPKNRSCNFVSVDISEKSIKAAEALISSLNIKNVMFKMADVLSLPFSEGTFDHVFMCFVLEHLSEYKSAITELKRVLKKGGTITLIEGDHGSACFHPDSEDARAAINCQVELQKRAGGDANIGRKLYPILKDAAFENIKVSPRIVYVDATRPKLVEGFTKNTFTAMIEGVREQAIKEKLISESVFDKGVADLCNTTQGNGVFCYTFFKATAVKG